jgi:hypothetical protein
VLGLVHDDPVGPDDNSEDTAATLDDAEARAAHRTLGPVEPVAAHVRGFGSNGAEMVVKR